jgi:hypothetical protein
VGGSILQYSMWSVQAIHKHENDTMLVQTRFIFFSMQVSFVVWMVCTLNHFVTMFVYLLVSLANFLDLAIAQETKRKCTLTFLTSIPSHMEVLSSYNSYASR